MIGPGECAPDYDRIVIAALEDRAVARRIEGELRSLGDGCRGRDANAGVHGDAVTVYLKVYEPAVAPLRLTLLPVIVRLAPAVWLHEPVRSGDPVS